MTIMYLQKPTEIRASSRSSILYARNIPVEFKNTPLLSVLSPKWMMLLWYELQTILVKNKQTNKQMNEAHIGLSVKGHLLILIYT